MRIHFYKNCHSLPKTAGSNQCETFPEFYIKVFLKQDASWLAQTAWRFRNLHCCEEECGVSYTCLLLG